ncbi:MAG TPA: hypothetical protein VH590_05660 [Ktedonobacterales bacterium]|jgi:hypothetical protein
MRRSILGLTGLLALALLALPVALLALRPLANGTSSQQVQSGAKDVAFAQYRQEKAVYQVFLKQLRATGAAVVEVDGSGPLPLSGYGFGLTVNGGWVEVYAYATPKDADNDVASISPDGSTFAHKVYHWSAPIHLFRRDQLIIFYMGEDRRVIAPLASLLGPQFAGNP